MSGSCRVALPIVWEALPVVREWSGDPAECPGVVRGHPGCPEVVWWPSQMSGSGRETLPDVRKALLDDREWSECPPVCPGGPPDHSQTFGRASGPLPYIQKCQPTTTGHLVVPPGHLG